MRERVRDGARICEAVGELLLETWSHREQEQNRERLSNPIGGSSRSWKKKKEVQQNEHR